MDLADTDSSPIWTGKIEMKIEMKIDVDDERWR
jgi:hypothetical protein